MLLKIPLSTSTCTVTPSKEKELMVMIPPAVMVTWAFIAFLILFTFSFLLLLACLVRYANTASIYISHIYGVSVTLSLCSYHKEGQVSQAVGKHVSSQSSNHSMLFLPSPFVQCYHQEMDTEANAAKR